MSLVGTESLTDLCEIVVDELGCIIQEKDKNRIVPNHVLDKELFDSLLKKYSLPQQDVRLSLNELYRTKRIRIGKTINNIYIVLSQT